MPKIKPNYPGITGVSSQILLTDNAGTCWHHTVAVSALLACCFCVSSFPLKCIASIVFLLYTLVYTLHSLTPVSFTQQNLEKMTQTSPERLPQRLVIYANDVISIHQCSKSTAARKIQEARDYHCKQDHQVITIAEYCSYFDLDFNDTITFLKLWK